MVPRKAAGAQQTGKGDRGINKGIKGGNTMSGKSKTFGAGSVIVLLRVLFACGKKIRANRILFKSPVREEVAEMLKKILWVIFIFTILVSGKKIKAEEKDLQKVEPTVGLYPLYHDGKVGYIDRTCKMVINPQFDYADDFSEGLAGVNIGGIRGKYGLVEGGKWGYIDKSGKFVIMPQFDFAWDFSEGLAGVKIGGKWGYIDKSGEIVIKPQFYFALSFSEGLAGVCISKECPKEGKWGYIDKTGKIVIEPQFDDAKSFSEGLARVWIGDRMTYIDKTGKDICSPAK